MHSLLSLSCHYFPYIVSLINSILLKGRNKSEIYVCSYSLLGRAPFKISCLNNSLRNLSCCLINYWDINTNTFLTKNQYSDVEASATSYNFDFISEVP